MYQRRYVWSDADAPSVHNESAWINTFTMENAGIDVRFTLAGYGWKPNATDTDLVEIYPGKYKCYYSTDGGSTWILFMVATCPRKNTTEDTIYGDVVVYTGELALDTFDIKVVAFKAALFTAWGSTLEGIGSGEQFWSGLKIRK